jgi:hypothetical protein
MTERPSSSSPRREWFERREEPTSSDWVSPPPRDAGVHRTRFEGFVYELRGRDGQLSLRVQELIESLSAREQLSITALLFALAMGLFGMARATMPERSEPEAAALSTTGPRE